MIACRLPVLAVAAAVGACGGDVHIRLVTGDCPSLPGGNGGLTSINAVSVQLIHRDPHVEYPACKDTYGYPTDMAALERQLASKIRFDVQSGGPWDLILIGFDEKTYCVTRPKPRPRLCGAVLGFTLPADTITVSIDCEFATADPTLKERIAACFAPVWPE